MLPGQQSGVMAATGVLDLKEPIDWEWLGLLGDLIRMGGVDMVNTPTNSHNMCHLKGSRSTWRSVHSEEIPQPTPKGDKFPVSPVSPIRPPPLSLGQDDRGTRGESRGSVLPGL